MSCRFGDGDAALGQGTDLLGGDLALGRQIAYFGGNHGEALATFASMRCFDSGIQGKQVGLVGNFVDDDDLVEDLAHGVDCVVDGVPAFGGVDGGMVGNALGGLGIV